MAELWCGKGILVHEKSGTKVSGEFKLYVDVYPDYQDTTVFDPLGAKTELKPTLKSFVASGEFHVDAGVPEQAMDCVADCLVDTIRMEIEFKGENIARAVTVDRSDILGVFNIQTLQS